jgi:hypothetical protein
VGYPDDRNASELREALAITEQVRQELGADKLETDQAAARHKPGNFAPRAPASAVSTPRAMKAPPVR